MGDTERFEFSLWDFAPDRWCTPEDRGEYEFLGGEILGEPGSEMFVFEIERSD